MGVVLIRLYSGVPGSGKSCHVAMDICTFLKQGVHVIANFDFNPPCHPELFHRIPEYPSCVETLALIKSLPRTRKEHNAVLIVDECQRVWNSRSWADKKGTDPKESRDAWCTFFSLSRHHGVDVILIAQVSSMVDKQIRGCVQTEVKHIRVAAMGAIPWIMSGFGRLPLCYWVESYFGTKIKSGSGFFLPRKRFWELYDSYSLEFE